MTCVALTGSELPQGVLKKPPATAARTCQTFAPMNRIRQWRSLKLDAIDFSRMADTPRQLRGFHVYCDESNTDSNKPYPIYGGILVSVNSLGTIQRALTGWRAKEQMEGEIAWTKVVPQRYDKYKSLVDLFFVLSRNGLIHFKAIILNTRDPQYRMYSKGDKELGFYKFYYHFLLRYFAKFPVRHRCHMEVIIDERHVKGDFYAALKVILNHGIRKHYKNAPTEDVATRVEPLGSDKSDFLQLADVLMGAIGFHCQDFHLRPNARKAKVNLAHYIARKAALRDLRTETAYLKEHFKIERWYWGPRPPRRRRPVNRRPQFWADELEP
jgi:hypothetical protein